MEKYSPAFPSKGRTGMSIHTYIAIEAMKELIPMHINIGHGYIGAPKAKAMIDPENRKRIAQEAFLIADAMVEEGKKRKEKENPSGIEPT